MNYFFVIERLDRRTIEDSRQPFMIKNKLFFQYVLCNHFVLIEIQAIC